MTQTLDIFKNEKNVRHFAPGEVIFSEGENGDYMCALIEGQVTLLKGGRILEEVMPGGIFGEMALIDKNLRSATATAQTECKVALIDQRRFTFLIQMTPFFALQVMRVMAQRLRRSTQTDITA